MMKHTAMGNGDRSIQQRLSQCGIRLLLQIDRVPRAVLPGVETSADSVQADDGKRRRPRAGEGAKRLVHLWGVLGQFRVALAQQVVGLRLLDQL